MLNKAVLHWFNKLSTQGILITDADLNICGWNHWLEQHTGRSDVEMIGRNLLEAYPDLALRGLDQYYRDALEGQVRVLAQRLHNYLLPVPYSVAGVAFAQKQQSARIAPLVENEQVVGTITFIDDVTERVAREQELEKLLASEQAARAEAEAANRAKDEFLAVVSHELRTPLNAIYGWVQILRSGKLDESIYAKALEALERNSRAQAKLIEDILDVSRIVTGKVLLDVRPVDLVTIIKETIETLRPAADAKRIRLRTALDSLAGPVSGDATRLQQVVWNLLANAIKFTPGKGRVEVRLERANSQAEITVTDTGQGISAGFLPHVFERFSQSDNTSSRKHGGLGLGLSIVRHLVEMHGGSVEAQSAGEGQGATFKVKLPLLVIYELDISSAPDTLQAAGSQKMTVGREDITVPSLEGLRVLIVDDEPDARDMLDLMLKQSDADVRVTATAREALEVLERWKPDVLVSDIGMPEEDGYALINKVRELDPERGGDIPALALTGYAGLADRLQLLSSGYQMHLAKPVKIVELVTAIEYLSGRTGKENSQ